MWGRRSCHPGLALWTLCLHLSSINCLECEYFNVTDCAVKGPDGSCAETRRTVTCEEPSNAQGCFVLWQRHNQTGKETVRMKGCFTNDKQCAGLETCVEKRHGMRKEKSPETAHHTLYCCCAKDLCNREYKWEPEPTPAAKRKPVLITADEPRTSPTVLAILIILPIVCCIFVGFLCAAYRRIWKKHLSSSSSGFPDEENILLDKPDSPDAPQVTLLEVKASGRFGNVWKASMAGHPSYVAVKIIPLREKASWKLEESVYALAFMKESDLVLRFMEARTITTMDTMQLWLISEFLEYGSLYDYLKGNVLTWNELLKISVTMCQGLAFLHEEIDAGAKGHKPAVAHRDFKSKNVLLRPDLTACLADFGLAHIFYPDVPVGTCHGQVGTRRYMAPEVLEGAVSFTRDNFQRIDMYACGLVLWELASRCSTQKGPIGEYRLPFEEYIGQHPTLEEMQDIVVTKRMRPTIRNDWLSHPGMAVLSEVLKDSWDQDAEARISASCIVERLTAVSNKLTVVI